VRVPKAALARTTNSTAVIDASCAIRQD
jgi:hypothetical protein